MSKVLSLDPSLRNTGYVVFEVSKKGIEVVESGVIETRKVDKKRGIRASDATMQSITELMTGLRKLDAKYKPALLIGEIPSSGGKSANAIKSMAIAQAACASLSVYCDLPSEWVSPRDNKIAMTGHGDASKHEMMDKARSLYPKTAEPFIKKDGTVLNKYEHVADAVGVFVALENTSSVIKYLKKE